GGPEGGAVGGLAGAQVGQVGVQDAGQLRRGLGRRRFGWRFLWGHDGPSTGRGKVPGGGRSSPSLVPAGGRMSRTIRARKAAHAATSRATARATPGQPFSSASASRNADGCLFTLRELAR